MSHVGVVGGGLYGCVVAVELAREGHEVELYERHADILHGASRTNQGRVHRGFHYPRSIETTYEAMEAAPRFEARYARALDRSYDHFYAIANTSRTPPADYLDFLTRAGLDHWVESPPWLRNSQLCVRARDECHVNLDVLREMLWRELATAHVRVRLGEEADRVVVANRNSEIVYATYGQDWPVPLQWEVVEVALVQLPAHLRRTSLVVMDGSFCSIDPVPGGLHMLYDVAASVHVCNVGPAPILSPTLRSYIDRGPIATGWSRKDALVASAAHYMAGAEEAQYQGSMFTIRAVLPNMDATDARPWSVHAGPRGLDVLPGKLASCLSAADAVVTLCRA